MNVATGSSAPSLLRIVMCAAGAPAGPWYQTSSEFVMRPNRSGTSTSASRWSATSAAKTIRIFARSATRQ